VTSPANGLLQARWLREARAPACKNGEHYAIFQFNRYAKYRKTAQVRRRASIGGSQFCDIHARRERRFGSRGAAIEEAFDAVAQRVRGLVDRMLYFPARQAWDHGRAPALLDILANGFAVVSFVAGHLLGIAVDVVHQGKAVRQEAQPTADAVGRKLLIVTASNPRELDELFPSLLRQGADTLVVRGSPLAYGWREQLAALAVRYWIPAIYPTRDNVEAGGLMSYGIDVDCGQAARPRNSADAARPGLRGD
jgi:hypothetical protein